MGKFETVDRLKSKTHTIRPRWRWLLRLVVASVVVTLLFAFSIQSLMHFIYFNGYAANGAFQLMNPLTRLAEGQMIGRDFQFFHGAGVPLVHYPLFALFGEGLFGSEMSRWFTSLGIFSLVTLFFIFTWYRGQKLKDRFTVLCVAFLGVFATTSLIADVITPSNSLLGIRTTMPIIVGIIILCRAKLMKRSVGFGKIQVNAFILTIATALAVAVLMGSEHGIASILAYSILEIGRILIAYRSQKRKILSLGFLGSMLPLAGTLGLSVALLLILSTVISAGHPVPILRYALITVPGDQFWYFGSEPQGYLQWGSIWHQLWDPSIRPLYVAIIASIALYFVAARRKLLGRHQWAAVIFLSLYGLLTLSSLLGYYTPALQIHGMMRVVGLIDSLIILQIILSLSINKARYLRWTGVIASAGVVIFASYISFDNLRHFDEYQTLKQTYKNMRGDHSELLAPEWRQRTDSFQPYISAVKSEPTPLWSTYASLYERENGLIHPSSDGCDYIIHCLGKEYRDQYTRDFIDKQPALVATLRPQYFTFEEWLWARHADFYEHLVNSYDIVAENDSHLLWKRVPAIDQSEEQSKTLKFNATTISLPTTSEASSQVIKVTIKYRTDPTYSRLPILNKLPRYMVRPVGTVSTFGVSLPPSESEWSFLLVLAKDSDTKQQLAYSADGILPNAHLSIEKASYTPIQVNDKEAAYFNEKILIVE